MRKRRAKQAGGRARAVNAGVAPGATAAANRRWGLRRGAEKRATPHLQHRRLARMIHMEPAPRAGLAQALQERQEGCRQSAVWGRDQWAPHRRAPAPPQAPVPCRWTLPTCCHVPASTREPQRVGMRDCSAKSARSSFPLLKVVVILLLLATKSSAGISRSSRGWPGYWEPAIHHSPTGSFVLCATTTAQPVRCRRDQ